MATLYEYYCGECAQWDYLLEPDSKIPGVFTEFRPYANRDDEILCPCCKAPAVRATAPRAITVRWLSSKSSKRYPIMEGPTQDRYIRGDERKKKEARQASRKQFAPLSAESSRLLKEDAAHVPVIAEAPKPGVSINKSESL